MTTHPSFVAITSPLFLVAMLLLPSSTASAHDCPLAMLTRLKA
jgi:hypothetical protein